MNRVHTPARIDSVQFGRELRALIGPHAGPVILSVSGGVDSMTLWHLVRVCEVPHVVAHVNFKLRGDASDADQQLVERTAMTSDTSVHTFIAPLGGGAAKPNGVQARARQIRISLTAKLSEEFTGAPILLAHHADDQLETVLMRLTRGTGGTGLRGMAASSPPFYRPLLEYSRAQIRAYAETYGVEYRDDASNATDDYTRNAFRHHVAPALKRVEPRTLQGIKTTVSRQADLVEFARHAAVKQLSTAAFAKTNTSGTVSGVSQLYSRRVMAETPGLNSLLYFWLFDEGFKSAQISTLLTWVRDGQPQKRRMIRPDGKESVVVAGERVYREPLTYNAKRSIR